MKKDLTQLGLIYESLNEDSTDFWLTKIEQLLKQYNYQLLTSSRELPKSISDFYAKPFFRETEGALPWRDSAELQSYDLSKSLLARITKNTNSFAISFEIWDSEQARSDGFGDEVYSGYLSFAPWISELEKAYIYLQNRLEGQEQRLNQLKQQLSTDADEDIGGLLSI